MDNAEITHAEGVESAPVLRFSNRTQVRCGASIQYYHGIELYRLFTFWLPDYNRGVRYSQPTLDPGTVFIEWLRLSSYEDPVHIRLPKTRNRPST